MGRTLLLFISCCAIIIFHISFSPAIKGNTAKYPVSSIQDTTKSAAAKAAAAKNAATSALATANGKAAAIKTAAAQSATLKAQALALANAKKAKLTKLIEALVKPFRFRNNEKKRIEALIHDYIVTDSVASAPAITDLNTRLMLVQTLISAINKQYTTDSILNVKHLDEFQLYKHTIDSLKKVALNNKPAPPAVKTKDTTAKAATTPAPLAPKNQPLPVTGSMQQKLNVSRDMFKRPLLDTIYTKNKDSVIIRKFTIRQKKQILGFYADSSRMSSSGFDSINYKLITTLVYAINADYMPFSLGRNAWIVDSAQRRNINVMFSFYTTSAERTNALINDESVKSTFIKKSLQLLNIKKETDVNFDLYGVYNNSKNKFEEFVNDVSNQYKQVSKKYTISITLPGNDKFYAYNLSALDQYAKYFIIDFTNAPEAMGPMSTLTAKSNNCIENCFNAYLSKGILANKFILGVPYYGAVWNNKNKDFLHYITYNNIEKDYADSAVTYNDDESAAKIQAKEGKTPVTIWYDDDKTLSGKYDFVINSALAGVAIKYIGDDKVNGELKNELVYKFISIDTTWYSAKRNILKASVSDFISHLFTSPCGHFVNHL